MISLIRDPSTVGSLDENHQLICDIIKLIKPTRYNTAIESLVELLVSEMPSDVLEQLTGKSDGDEEALEMLLVFYSDQGIFECLSDCLKMLRAEHICACLDKVFNNQ